MTTPRRPLASWLHRHARVRLGVLLSAPMLWLGVAYLGTQGDPWDAQKDMALASAGAIGAMLVTAAINWHTQRDFAREWAESLRVKRPDPLGEDALASRRREEG